MTRTYGELIFELLEKTEANGMILGVAKHGDREKPSFIALPLWEASEQDVALLAAKMAILWADEYGYGEILVYCGYRAD